MEPRVSEEAASLLLPLLGPLPLLLCTCVLALSLSQVNEVYKWVSQRPHGRPPLGSAGLRSRARAVSEVTASPPWATRPPSNDNGATRPAARPDPHFRRVSGCGREPTAARLVRLRASESDRRLGWMPSPGRAPVGETLKGFQRKTPTAGLPVTPVPAVGTGQVTRPALGSPCWRPRPAPAAFSAP